MTGTYINQKNIGFTLLIILMIIGHQVASFAQTPTDTPEITPVVERTSQVADAIVAALGVESAEDVTDEQLTEITSLNLRNKSITQLKSGDFSGMTKLTNLNLYDNQLSSLPDGIFEGLTSLTTLRLGKKHC
ncbi:leucine-rich repeat domain-containing protein [Candidatus Poribacteria bacterium]|nr:leucine-rich repeat domain-containing protein [Candidatus Poribacteria bacterium]